MHGGAVLLRHIEENPYSSVWLVEACSWGQASPTHTHAETHRQYINTHESLFICMTSEPTNLKATEVVLPAAFKTKVR